MNWDIERRTIEEVYINPDTVHDGDLFIIMRLDGVDPLIMYGTGAHAGHCTCAMRFEDGELYIVEV